MASSDGSSHSSCASRTSPTVRLRLVRPQGEEFRLGDHGRTRATFRRALERGNVVVAEIEARDVGPLDLSEALELTALVCLRDRPRGQRYALRWLARWLEETPASTLDETVLVVGALAALGGAGHAAAVLSLRAVAGRATGRRGLSPVR